MVSLVGGSICLVFQVQDSNRVFFFIPQTLKTVVPLFLNILVTVLIESMGYIHTCSLRWALFREGRLEFASNLRLFTFTCKSGANSWFANLVVLIGIVLSYASTSFVLLCFNPELANDFDKDVDFQGRTRNYIHINGIGLLTFGVGLLLQAGVAGWILGKREILTWSSNPLTIAQTCLHADNAEYPLQYQNGKCMMSVHMRRNDFPDGINPSIVQKSMFSAHPNVKWAVCLLWVISLTVVSWGIALHFLVKDGIIEGIYGDSWTFLPNLTGGTTSNICNAIKCTDGTLIFNLGWTQYNSAVGSLGSVFMVVGFQVLVTLAVHAAELIVNLSRDEKTYRELGSPQGTNPRYRSIGAAFFSFPVLLLCLFKASIHWVFGLGVSLVFMLGVNMYAPQLIYLGCFMAGLALFCTYLAVRRATGFLPSSYGHVQTIVNIIDEWYDSGAMYWGHKADADEDGKFPAFAGTSSSWLEDPNPREKYGGPKRENDKHRILKAVNKVAEERRRETMRRESSLATVRSSWLMESKRQTMRSVHSNITFDMIQMKEVAVSLSPLARPSTSYSNAGFSPPSSPGLDPPNLRYGGKSNLSHQSSLGSHHSQSSLHSSYSVTSGISQRPLVPLPQDHNVYTPYMQQQRCWPSGDMLPVFDSKDRLSSSPNGLPGQAL